MRNNQIVNHRQAPGVEGDLSKTDGNQSIRRAVNILLQVATYDLSGVRLVDIMERLKLERSTAHRILKCLVSEGLLMQKVPGKRYVLGHLAFELGLRAGRREKLRQVCRSSLERIAQQSGDVAFLSVKSGLDTVCIDRAEGNYPIRAYTREIGDRRPMGFGAVGVAILALMPDDQMKQILHSGAAALQSFSKETIADALRRVTRARNRGYALYERKSLRLRAMAVGIRNQKGEPFAAISLCAIGNRLKATRRAELAKMIKIEVKIIEDALARTAAARSAEKDLARMGKVVRDAGIHESGH